jgi:membrane metallo-endopeptidase-like protein 1
MDRSAAPCTDFFQYACGTWNRLHVIPEDRSSVSTFEVLADQLQVILKGLLEEPAESSDSNATLKAKLFYRSCMDIRGYNENITENYDETLPKDMPMTR